MKLKDVEARDLVWAVALTVPAVVMCFWTAYGTRNSAAFWQAEAVPFLGHLAIWLVIAGPIVSVITVWGRTPLIQAFYIAYFAILLWIDRFLPRPYVDGSVADQFIRPMRYLMYSLLMLFLLVLLAAMARRRFDLEATKSLLLLAFIVVCSIGALSLPTLL